MKIEEIKMMTMEQIDNILPSVWVELSQEQISAFPVLPVGLRISISITPVEQVVATFNKYTDQELENYPASFVAALSAQQFDALSDKIRSIFGPKLEKGLKALSDLYINDSEDETPTQ